MFHIVQASDSVGEICLRHGLTREEFFFANPEHEIFLLEDGSMTTQLYEGDTVCIHVESDILERLKSAATSSSGECGGASLEQLKPAQLKALGLLAQFIKDGKISGDVGELIAADIGRSGAAAGCVYMGVDPATAASLCGAVGDVAGKKAWPFIKKGGETVGRLAVRGGSYAYDKSKGAVSAMGDVLTSQGEAAWETLKNAPDLVTGNVAGYISCVKEKKDPFSCAQQAGVDIVADTLGKAKDYAGEVIKWGQDAACSTLGLFCKSSPPQPPPAGPSLPPEPSMDGRTLNEYVADLVVYIKQYAALLSPDRLASLQGQLEVAIGTSIAFCSSVAWAKIPEDLSRICKERVSLVIKSGVNAILNEPASADPSYALELVKAVRFGVAMDAVEFVLASSVDLATRLAILFLLSNKQEGSIPSDVGHALFLSQVASLVGAGVSSPEDSFRLLGSKDAASMIWYGLLGEVDKSERSVKDAGSEAVQLLLRLMAENMPRQDMGAVVAKMVVDRNVSPEEAERGVAKGLSKGCKENDCIEKATEESRAIVTQADAIVAGANVSGGQSSSKDGLPWWGWLLIGTGVVGGGAAIYRTSQGLPVLPTNWSKPLSLRGFDEHRSTSRHRGFVLQQARSLQSRPLCTKPDAAKSIGAHRERPALGRIDRRRGSFCPTQP